MVLLPPLTRSRPGGLSVALWRVSAVAPGSTWASRGTGYRSTCNTGQARGGKIDQRWPVTLPGCDLIASQRTRTQFSAYRVFDFQGCEVRALTVTELLGFTGHKRSITRPLPILECLFFATHLASRSRLRRRLSDIEFELELSPRCRLRRASRRCGRSGDP